MKLPPIHFKSGPENDWKVIFSFSILLVLVLIIFNIFTFFSQPFIKEDEGNVSEQTLSLEKLKQTVSYYQAKEKEFQRIIRNYDSPFSDPSI